MGDTIDFDGLNEFLDEMEESINMEEIEKDDEPNDDEVEVQEILPCIPLRGVTIFPNTVVHFDVGREKSIKALERAMDTDKLMFVASQKNDEVLLPQIQDIYPVGTVIKVRQMLKLNKDTVRVLVEGQCRAILDECVSDDEYIACTVKKIHEDISQDDFDVEIAASYRLTEKFFAEYTMVATGINEEASSKIVEKIDPVEFVDSIADAMDIKTAEKQKVLSEIDFKKRVQILNELLQRETQIIEIEKDLSAKLKENIDKSQKEYYLKEKINTIRKELGIDEDAENEASRWVEDLEGLELDEKIENKVKKEINKYSRMSVNSAESAVIRNYIETVLDLPWNKSTEINNNLKEAEKILDEDHYGLKKVKERILEHLAVTKLVDSMRGPILCLTGPPGVGKTSVAKSIARATGREYVRMSLGGVRDEAEIRGHRRTYIGAIPGRIVNGIIESGSNNPLFLLDEIDKVGADFKGDPASALLEVLDPEQNSTFTDHFLEIPFDLSNVMFITTANSTDTIPAPLLDRMEIIEVSGYTEGEKVRIAEKYLIEKELKKNGLTKENLRISTNAIHDIVNYYTRESGVRNLERKIADICRKVAKRVVIEEDKPYRVNCGNLETYLGKHRYSYDKVSEKNRVGVTTGMAWTSVGGVTLTMECAVLPGSGKIQLTGSLGDVMKESATTAMSYARSIADRYSIDEKFYEEKDVHIHAPEGAVPKDGPSAGVTMLVSIISALTDTPVDRTVAMTGEITLRGAVLPVGGIREKVLAAHRSGSKKILLPVENKRDVDEIPENVRKELEFVFIENAEEALKEALVK